MMDAALFEEQNFVARAEALDWLELGAAETGLDPGSAADLARRLTAVDEVLFARIRGRVRCGECRGETFRAMVSEYVGPDWTGPEYDHLDLFMSHLFGWREVPMPTRELEPEMVEYYKTPARVVFDLVERCGIRADDIFIDLGSGLGQVVLLVNLLSGARATGIEIEPAFCEYAREGAAQLGLRDVSFVTADVRTADLSAGSAFFLYTPFKGAIMDEVLGRLRSESLSRPIRVIPYGPCTEAVRAASIGSYP
jgi:hypothetical protein